MPNWLTQRIFAATGSVIDGWLSGEPSATVVNEIVNSTRHRPPWSTFSDYTSWQGLTDRTYLARHLPPADVPKKPPASDVQKLFQRRAGAPARISKKSTCLFPAFAQYLTDGSSERSPPTRAALPPITKSICAHCTVARRHKQRRCA
jgi:prostaglandin-endoperoxide synthase 2